MHYRPQNCPQQYKPSPFSMILINKEGEIISTSREYTMSNFLHAMVVDRSVLDANKYTLVVDVVWD
jgi:hypothetical protein